MKILVLGDLHGQIPKIHFKDFDAIICVGDICKDKDIKKHMLISYKEFLSNPHTSRNWYDIIGKAKAKTLTHQSLDAGRKVLIRLNALNVPIYIIPGNWDWVNDGEKEEWDYLNKNHYKKYLVKGLKNIHDCHGKNIIINDNDDKHTYSIIGYGLVNGPELLKFRQYNNIPKHKYKKNVLKYKRLVSKYSKIFSKTRNSEISKILLSHNVPFNTKLDIIVNKESPMDGYHYGSNLARDLIIKYKPLLCISGHMHEHYGTCKIGKTVVLNAGFGGNNNTLVEFKNGKLQSIKFHGKKK